MTAITGAHSILYSTNPEADRAFLRDVLGFPHVDAGGGWLIFGLPPAEVAVHPSGSNDVHELLRPADQLRPAARRRARTGADAARTASSSSVAESGRVTKTVGSPPAIAIARRNSCSRSGPRTTASTVGASGSP